MDNIDIMKELNKTMKTMPALAMRDLVVFPNMIIHFDVARKRSINSLKRAMANDGLIFLVSQKDVFVESPNEKDVYAVGVVAKVKRIIKSNDNHTRALVQGIKRMRLVEFCENDENTLTAVIKRYSSKSKLKSISETEEIALQRAIKEAFQEYASVVPKMPHEAIDSVMLENDKAKLFDAIVFNISLHNELRQELLEAPSIQDKLTLLLTILTNETEVLSIEKQIHEIVATNIDKNQRDYYLREQLKVIQEQLGEGEEFQNDSFEYMMKISNLSLEEETSKKLASEASRLEKMSPSSQEASVIRTYLDTCLALPWNKSTKDKTDIEKSQKILDKDHYGLKKVKDRILETFAVRQLAPDVKGQIICLVGPPGVGKTSIGRSIAKAMGRKYVRVSLGGVKDESDIRGHRKTYIGAMPGRIINAIKLAGSNNPLILLDEIDKMSNDFRGDPSSALLEVLDSEQNFAFRDHYIEIPFDLSNVLFVTTANSLDTIAQPLLDRMEVIDLSSYTREEKFNICKKHLVAKQLKKNGLKASICKFNDDALYSLIDSYTKEAGVRSLERRIATLCRKAAKEIVTGDVKKVIFKAENLENYIGAKKYLDDFFLKENEVGVVNGLAWTSVGGVIMPLEVLTLDGKGNIELTGSLGDVMKESAKIAVSYCRSIADKYNIDKEFYNNKDIHIHAPEGAVPKDGPSAGVALITSLVSALSQIPVRADVAMTGEITLHGKVLPIGGLKEKTMAAYKAGVKTVIVPKANKADLDEVDDVIKSSLHFVFAEKIQDVLDIALADKPKNPHDEYNISTKSKKSKEHTTVVC